MASISDIARLTLPLYVLFIVGIGFVFTSANDLTKQEGQLAYFSEVYFLLLYVTSTAALLLLNCYIIPQSPSQKLEETARDKAVKSNLGSVTDIELQVPKTQDGSTKERTGATVRYRKKGINFYFLLGGLTFGAGAVIHDVFSIADYVTYGEKSCLHALDVTCFTFRLMLVCVTAIFVVRQNRVIIDKDTTAVRFLIVHVIATNICMWIHASVHEAAEDFRHDEAKRLISQEEILKNAQSNGGLCVDFSPNRSESCYIDRELRSLSSPYLTPCRIEFTLFVIPALYQILVYVGSDWSHNMEDDQSEKVQEGRHMKIWRMIKTVHVGFIVLVVAIIAVGIFFLYSEAKADSMTAQLVFHGTEVSVLVILVVGLLIGFFYLKQLHFMPNKDMSLDESLLMVAITGHILYDISRLLASVRELNSAESTGIISLVAAVFSLAEVLLQTLFILFSLRLGAENEHQAVQKPGRGAIGLILVCNLAMWLLATFESKKTTMVPLYTNYYGYLSWALISYALTPLLIFFRFHSTVLLSDIWKEAYEKRKCH